MRVSTSRTLASIASEAIRRRSISPATHSAVSSVTPTVVEPSSSIHRSSFCWPTLNEKRLSQSMAGPDKPVIRSTMPPQMMRAA